MLRRLPFERGGRAPTPNASGPNPLPPPSDANDLSIRGPLGARFSASFTRKLRPPSSNPSNFWIAVAADSSLEYSTKANPRGRPVARSVGSTTSTMSPASAKTPCSSSFVVSKLRLPTNTLELMAPPLRFRTNRNLMRSPRSVSAFRSPGFPAHPAPLTLLGCGTPNGRCERSDRSMIRGCAARSDRPLPFRDRVAQRGAWPCFRPAPASPGLWPPPAGADPGPALWRSRSPGPRSAAIPAPVGGEYSSRPGRSPTPGSCRFIQSAEPMKYSGSPPFSNR